MKTIHVGVCTPRIVLGRRGETLSTEVVFDLSELISTYGNGTATLLARRASDVTAYIVANYEQSGSTLTWTVTDVDTAVVGAGRAELFWYVDEALAKTIIYDTYVGPDIGEPGDPPDPYEDWLEVLGELTAETHANAEAAEEYSLKSEGYAIGTQDGEPVSSGPYYHNNAEYYSVLAEQAASQAGYITVEIDSNGHLIFTKTTTTDLNFYLDSNGHLILEVA